MAVEVRDVLAVHRPCDQRFLLEGLRNRHAARNRNLVRVAARVRIGAVVGHVNGVVPDTNVFQHVFKAHAGPLRAADRAYRPLVAGGGRYEFAAAVAATLDLQLVGVVPERFLQLGYRERRGALRRFAADLECPARRIDARQRGFSAVVTHEQVLARRNAVIEQVGGRLRIDRPVVQDDEAFLAGDRERLVGLGQRRGYQASRHEMGKWDRGTDSRGHCGEAAFAEESSACQRVALAAPDDFVGSDRIIAVEFMNSAFLLRHRHAPFPVSEGPIRTA